MISRRNLSLITWSTVYQNDCSHDWSLQAVWVVASCVVSAPVVLARHYDEIDIFSQIDFDTFSFGE